MKQQGRGEYLLSLLASVIFAMLIGGVIMAATGINPIEGYGALFSGALGDTKGIGTTLYKTALLAITGLATAVASQAGIFNVGGEGQMYLGALMSAQAGVLMAGVSPWIAVPVCLLVGMLSGALYALIPAVMKVKLKINEVITTIMMNSIAIYFCTYMANGPWKATDRSAKGAMTVKLDSSLLFNKLIIGSNLTTTVFVIAAFSLIVWYLMRRSTLGYEMKLTGQNERFARFSGLSAGRLMILGMLISGALCGMLGMLEVFGVQKRFRPDFSNELYFDGMLVAMIVQYRPLSIVVMSVFFGILKSGTASMQQMNVSNELINLIQAIIIFCMAAEKGVIDNIRAKRVRRRAILESAAREVKG